MTERASTNPGRSTKPPTPAGYTSEAEPETPSISRDLFGVLADGTEIEIYTLRNGSHMEITVLTYGGILQSVLVPDGEGKVENVTLGFDNLEGYVERNDAFFGGITGRYANRIAAGRFTLNGVEHQLTINEALNHLHGGAKGFDKRVWTVTQTYRNRCEAGVELSYVSGHGEEGYPGSLDTRVTYTLTPRSEIVIDYRATTDAPTVVNITNHAYWNLAGEAKGSVAGHMLELGASHYTPVTEELIPTGEIIPVAGTALDFTHGRALDPTTRLEPLPYPGYDHNFVLDGTEDGLGFAALLTEPSSGRTLSIDTTEPGLQVYSGGLLDGTLIGPGGRPYHAGAGLALETQHFPDSPNNPQFPSTVLEPGEEYHSTTVYRFGF